MMLKKILLFLLAISIFSGISEAAVQQMYLVNANAISSTCFAGLASPIGIGNLSYGSEGQVIKTTGGVAVWGTDNTGGGGANVATTTCSGTQKVSAINNNTGEVTCSADADTNTYNTTAEMRNAVNNSGTYNISINASNVLNAPWLLSYVETDLTALANISSNMLRWLATNTTQEMRNAVNNTPGTFNISVNQSDYCTTWLSASTKENTITAGATTQYWRGDKTWWILNTSIVPEVTNLYFTNARAVSAVNNSGTYNISINASNVLNPTWISGYTETDPKWQGNYSLVAFVSNLVGMLGNWSADKASYATTTSLTSVGNWTADRGNYINTTRAWTNDTNMGISGTTLTWLGTLADGRIASASTWNAKAGTGACSANQFAISTTTGGVTCFQPVGANISAGTITTTQLATGTLNQANLTNTVSACSNQFSRGMGATTQNCATVGNADMTSGDYAAITGIGTQAENLNMSNYNVTGVQCIVFKGGGTWCTA